MYLITYHSNYSFLETGTVIKNTKEKYNLTSINVAEYAPKLLT